MNKPLLGSVFGACTVLAYYARFVRGTNILWLVGSYVPLGTTYLYCTTRQPSQLLHNCYNYLLTKRAGTVEMQEGYAKFSQQPFTATNEFKTLKDQLSTSNKTLYELENELVSSISAGRF